MEHLPILFFATLLAAIVASAPPGLLNVNAAKISVEKGKKSGIIFSLGIAVMVFIQAYISVRIAKFLIRNPHVVGWLMKAAVVVFAVLAVFFFVKATRKQIQHSAEIKQGKTLGDFGKGLFLASLNFLQIPFYSGLNTFFGANGIMTYEIIDEVIFIAGAGIGTFLVMYLYVFYFNKLDANSSKFSKNSYYVLGVLMVILLVITLIRINF